MNDGFRRLHMAMLLLVASACVGAPTPVAAQTQAHPRWLLARVDAPGSTSSFPLSIYAKLQDADGQDYVLVKATDEELDGVGQSHQVLDSDAESAVYILAYEFRAGARASARGKFNIIHDDGKRLLVRSSSGDEIEALADLGFQCRPLSAKPMNLAPPGKWAPSISSRMAAVSSNASVSAMIAQVKQTNLYAALDELTGVQPVFADGSTANIRTRHQNSGVPLRRATALANERFTALGLQTSYQAWTSGGRSNRNVVGVQPGVVRPSEIVVVCAHIDDMPSSGDAPGADDNASGSVAVLAAAEILRNFSFDRTIRYILFTGEEQGLLGSEACAQAAEAAGDNIAAVLNLDMVAWDGNGDGAVHLYVRPASDAGHAADREIAAVFTNVVRMYGLRAGLAPEIVSEVSDWSDHYSFTSHGFPAVCAIEEDVDDFNPYYHTSNDTIARLNLPYYTRFVQAAIGTVAHLASSDGRNSPSYFSTLQSVGCAGPGWSRTFVMDLTNFRNLAVQDGYQSYTVNYLLYYNIWTGIYLYGYDSGKFDAVTWSINLDL